MKKSIFSLVVLFTILGTTTANAQRRVVYSDDDMYVPTREVREVHVRDLHHVHAGRHDRVVEVRHHPAHYREVRRVEPVRVDVVRPVRHRTVVVEEPVPVPVPAPVVVTPHRSSSAVTGMVVGAVLGTVVGSLIR